MDAFLIAHYSASGRIDRATGRVCLVTASSGRRWIIPKGTLEPSQTGPECAAAEAWEEAGIADGRPRSASPNIRHEGGRPSVVACIASK